MLSRDFDVRNYGAVPDGATNNTTAIQCAIDDCTAHGGGRVIICGGKFMTGTLELRNCVELHLAADAVLLGSPICEDYPELPWRHVNTPKLPRGRGTALIRADECQNIAVTGYGTIDCNGEHFIRKSENGWMPYERIPAPTPPRVIMFAGCRNFRLEGFTMTNQPAGWSVWLTDCNLGAVHDIKLLARLDYPNNDGLHINCSRDIRVSDCTISCGDDAIVVRANSAALEDNTACERIVVTNCTLTSHCNGIRIGWTNDGTIRNCSFSNLVMADCSNGIAVYLPPPKQVQFPDVGREDTRIENLSFNGIIMDQTFCCPINIAINESPLTRCAAIRNLFFSNIRSSSHQMPRIIGRKNAVIENVEFNDCQFEVTACHEDTDLTKHGGLAFREHAIRPPVFSNVRGLRFKDTDFTALDAGADASDA